MRRYRWPILASFLALLFFAWQDPYRERLELSSYDFRQGWTQRPAGIEPIYGSIDEVSMELLGPWPWPRQAHALLLDELFSQQAKFVFLDLLLEESREGDVDLSRALAKGPSVLGARLDLVNSNNITRMDLVPPAPAFRGATQLGLLHRLDDEDTLARRGLVMAAVYSSSQGGRTYPSPALVMYLHHLGAAQDEVELFLDDLPLASALANLSHLPDGEHSGRAVVKGRIVPLQATVHQADQLVLFTILTRYHQPSTGPTGTGRQVIPYVKLPEAQVAGRYVVVGENTKSDADTVATPLGRMKGMEVHAQTFQSLVDENHLRALGYPGLLLCFWAIVIALVMTRTDSARSTVFAMLGLGGVYFALNLGFFALGRWLPLTTPLLQLAVATVLILLLRLILARSAFAELASPEAAAEMLVSNTGEELEAEAVDAVVVVTDIRGYTTLSETRSAEGMLDLLNEYHTATVAVYQRHGGRALTYQGDAQLVVFGYPKRQKDPGTAAVRACMELEGVCHELRRKWGVADDVFSVGAAVCYGPVVVGRLGAAESQIQYTVIGEVVRKAHKVQSMSDKLASATLVDEETVATMKSAGLLQSLGPVEVDGLSEPAVLYKPRIS